MAPTQAGTGAPPGASRAASDSPVWSGGSRRGTTPSPCSARRGPPPVELRHEAFRIGPHLAQHGGRVAIVGDDGAQHVVGADVAVAAVAGTGEVDTYTINYQPWMPGLEVPFVIARVKLDGVPDVILTTNIVNCDVEDVDFGDKVKVTFEEQDGIRFLLFEKVA